MGITKQVSICLLLYTIILPRHQRQQMLISIFQASENGFASVFYINLELCQKLVEFPLIQLQTIRLSEFPM